MDIDAGVPRAPTATSLEIPSQPQRRPLIGFSAAPNSPHSDMQSFRVAWRKVPGVDRERDRTPTPTPAAALDQQVAAAIENLALAFATPEDDLIDD